LVLGLQPAARARDDTAGAMNNERRIAEEALRESEQRWRSLIEALPQLVWSATPDGANDYVSTKDGIHRRRRERAARLALDGCPAPDDRQSTRQIWTDSVAERRAYDVEYRVRRHDGTYGWFKTRGVPIRDSNGNVVKWFGSCTDITDRKRAEEALRESEQRWRSLTEALPQLVWSTTPDGATITLAPNGRNTPASPKRAARLALDGCPAPDDRKVPGKSGPIRWRGAAPMTWNTACAGTTERTAGSRRAACRSATATATSSSGSGPAPITDRKRARKRCARASKSSESPNELEKRWRNGPPNCAGARPI